MGCVRISVIFIIDSRWQKKQYIVCCYLFEKYLIIKAFTWKAVNLFIEIIYYYYIYYEKNLGDNNVGVIMGTIKMARSDVHPEFQIWLSNFYPTHL